MQDDITIKKADGTWVVRTGGAVIAESTDAIMVTEGDRPFVIYFPRDDVAMAFLDASEHRSDCPTKGTAHHFDIVSKSVTLKNAVWSYEDPKAGASAIKGHLAFNAQDDVTVERI
ncbi:DUF427 domain-containing protein [Marivita sp. S2033]|uniref:DUF427 domain-containing protein n=1 Tax=Marivita sp. S2033 TaxID=3373187 RepID=UPI003981A3EF